MDFSTPEHLAVIDHLLTTTRAVRKRLDFSRPVEPETIERCIEIAVQAPSGSNRQGWHFLVVTDETKRARIGDLYHQAFDAYDSQSPTRSATQGDGQRPTLAQMRRVISSARYLAENMHRVPVLIIPCIEGRRQDPSPQNQAGFYGSILPATWSLALALRARGLGTAWTTLHLRYEQEVAALLALPDSITQAALLPVAYFRGQDFRPASRLPAVDRTYWNSWNRSR